MGRKGSDAPVADELGATEPMDYWQRRADAHRSRAVLNLGHGERDVRSVTRRQRKLLFPRLERLLPPGKLSLLDFGCGAGRFSPGLADLIDGHVYAVDPIQSLLDLAPSHPRVSYVRNEPPAIPLDDASMDVVWICLVLGGIVAESGLRSTLSEIDRVLRPSGLLFLVENTDPVADDDSYWVFRSRAQYREACSFAGLAEHGTYYDLGQEVSILAGPKVA